MVRPTNDDRTDERWGDRGMAGWMSEKANGHLDRQGRYGKDTGGIL